MNNASGVINFKVQERRKAKIAQVLTTLLYVIRYSLRKGKATACSLDNNKVVQFDACFADAKYAHY